MLKDIFDEYSLKARVTPALLVLLPALISVAVWLPMLYNAGKALIGLLVSCGIVVVLANFARENGKKIEKTLWQKWGGAPATMALHHGTGPIDKPSKDRYHQFLESKINNWKIPSPAEEKENPRLVFEMFNTAISWLKEQTRDKNKFPLVFAENINYGFRRNVLGLKPIGIFICLICVFLNAWLCYGNLCAQGVATFLVCLLLLVWWLAVVSGQWVKKAADEYSNKLLASCDLLAG